MNRVTQFVCFATMMSACMCLVGAMLLLISWELGDMVALQVRQVEEKQNTTVKNNKSAILKPYKITKIQQLNKNKTTYPKKNFTALNSQFKMFG